MTSLLVISHDVVGQRMAGPGIRMWELARALAGVMPITLIAPRPIDLLPPAGLACGHYAWGDASSLMPYLATASAVLANGYVAAAHPELLDYHGRLIIDLYDPIAFENLELFRRQPPHQRQTLAERDVTLLRLLIERGDHFLCATERQRDLYIGALLAMGRITPDILDNDPLLQNLIMVVPFGVSDEPPQPSGQPALRGALDDLGPQHHIILWSGGLWDWMDPQTLARAMPAVLTAVPEARLVFLAGRHPGAVDEMATPVVTRQLAADLGLLGRGIHFYDDWIPYERRADFLLEAAVMVSLHREHLETRYAAVRSRVLDHFWAGKASVLSAGDAAADLIIRHQAGEVVPIGDADAVAEALLRVLTNPERRLQQERNAAALGQSLRWTKVVQPLLAILNCPTKPVTLVPNEKRQLTMEDTLAKILRERNELIKALELRWNLSLPAAGNSPLTDVRRQFQQRLTGHLEQSLSQVVSQQREFNAAMVNLVYRLASAFDEQMRRVEERNAQYQAQHQNVAAHLASLTQQLAELKPLTQAIQHLTLVLQQNVQALHDEIQKLHHETQILRQDLQRAYDTLPPLHQHVIDLEQRVLDLDEAHSQMVAHLHRLLSTIQSA